MDCFAFWISEDSESYGVLVERIEQDHIYGLLWDGRQHKTPCRVPYLVLKKSFFRAHHYIGLMTVTYDSPWKFLAREIIGISYIVRYVRNIRQRLFNIKTLHRKSRMDILEIIIQERIDYLKQDSVLDRDSGIFIIDLLAKLYNERVFGHPQYADLKSRTQIALDSLVESKDVIKNSIRYISTGKALHTVSMYEEDNRRHRDQLIQNWAIIILTLVIAGSGVLQLFGVGK